MNGVIVPAGDAMFLVRFDDRLDEGVNRRVAGAAQAVIDAHVAGVTDVVPAFRSVAVHFDPVAVNVVELERALHVAAQASAPAGIAAAHEREAIRIPVEYGGAAGPDLGAVAEFAGISEDDVIERHCARTYRVSMLGFVPGFAYLGPVDERIAMPRLASPRTLVPSGSVGIAGAQTGIYPSATPGGWRLIGRTSTRPFDLSRANPFLFKPGDRVRFYRDAGT
jgi:inhibitor of KinA